MLLVGAGCWRWSVCAARARAGARAASGALGTRAAVAQEHVRPLAFGWQLLIALTLAYQGQRVVRLAAFGRRAVRWLALSAAVAGYFIIGVHLYARYGILLDLYPLIAFMLAHALLVHSARKLGLWKRKRR